MKVEKASDLLARWWERARMLESLANSPWSRFLDAWNCGNRREYFFESHKLAEYTDELEHAMGESEQKE